MVSTDQKLEDITRALLQELTGGITSDIIDRQSFTCYPESPTHVTYRARLEGTSETDSGSLISLIEDWVGSGTGIIVTGVLMIVDSECSVAISSLTEGECSSIQPPTTGPTTSSITDPTISSTTSSITDPTISSTTTSSSQSSSGNTAAIIGGAVAVLLIIAITVIAVVALILKYRRGNLSSQRVSYNCCHMQLFHRIFRDSYARA